MGFSEEAAAVIDGAKQAASIGVPGGDAAIEETPLMGDVNKDNLGIQATEEETPAAEAAPADEPKIIIGDRSFGTKEEAWAYAQDLQQKVESEGIANDMYRQGIKDAMLGQPEGNKVTEEVEPEDNFDEEFYSDPQAYMKKMQEQADTKAKAIAQKMLDDRDADANRVKETQALWDSFYGANEDLRSKDLLVQAVLSKDWAAYEHLQPKAAMTKLSAAVRTELRAYGLDAQPAQELSQAKGTVSTGGGQNVTTPAQGEKTMDFISQINNIQSKGINS